ncbi:winged helix-turn-helix domain-containing protein [Leisingera sp.]|uniref:winged helix-turn-helix domain-containing protein n=1 Tax=Leisingera sp. TaxID=1879318 RepID=UPI002B265CD3|nr:winged helix-turn-helix domain-containing protein [Leisingera sp.]
MARLIGRHGEEICLRPQSAQVLDLLAASIGRTVSKTELFAEVWPEISVTEDSLCQCIADIRRALGDKQRTILRTVPKRGYVLTASGGFDSKQLNDPAPAGQNTVLALEAAGGVLTPDILGLLGPGIVCGLAFHQRASRRQLLVAELSGTGAAISLALKLSEKMRRQGGHSESRIALDIANAAPPGGQEVPSLLAEPRASRLVSLAAPGEVLATAGIREAAQDGTSWNFEDLGKRCIRGEMVHVFQVTPVTSVAGGLRSAAEGCRPSVAVIPFRALPTDQEDILGEMLADDIISTLSQSQELNVVSRLAATAHHKRDPTPADLRDRLAADAVLSGRYTQSGGRLVLRVELADTRSQMVLWADRIEAECGAVLKDMTIACRIASGLRTALGLIEPRQVQIYPAASLGNCM